MRCRPPAGYVLHHLLFSPCSPKKRLIIEIISSNNVVFEVMPLLSTLYSCSNNSRNNKCF